MQPHRHWVTFENVSLQPRPPTDVKLKVESKVGPQARDATSMRQQVDAIVDRFAIAVRRKAEFLDDEQLEALRLELRDYLLERVARPVSEEWQQQVLRAVELFVVDVHRRPFDGPTRFMMGFEVLKWHVWTALDRDELTPEQLTLRESQRKWFREFTRTLPDPSCGKIETWTHQDGSTSEMTTLEFKLKELEEMMADPLNPYFAWPFTEKEFQTIQTGVREQKWLFRKAELTGATNVVFYPVAEQQRGRVSKRWPIKRGEAAFDGFGKNLFQWDSELAKRPLSALKKTPPQEEKPADKPTEEAAEATKQAGQRIEMELRNTTEIAFSDTPLWDVVQYLSDYHNISIQLHPSAQGVADTPATSTMTSIELADALALILHEAKLSSCIDKGVLLIATPEEIRKRGGPFPRGFADDLAKLQKADASVRWATLLSGVVEDSDFAAIPKLTGLLGSDDVVVQRSAARALTSFGTDARAAQPGLEKLTRSQNSRVAFAAWQALVAIGLDDLSTFPLLWSALEQGDETVTDRWLTLFMSFDEKVWSEVGKRFPPGSAKLRQTLAAHIVFQREETKPVVMLALSDPDDETRRVVLRRLLRSSAEVDSGEWLPTLNAHLKDSDIECRIVAAMRLLLLKKSVEPAVTTILTEAAHEPGREVLRKCVLYSPYFFLNSYNYLGLHQNLWVKRGGKRIF